MRNITIFVEEAINELERQIAETGKHVIKTESIKDLVNPRIIISGANDDSTYLAEIGFGQVIQSRLYEHGYRSLGKGYFVNLNSCRDVHYLMMLYDNADTSVADKVRIRKLIKEHREINRELWSSDDSESTGEYPDDLEKTIRMHTKAVFKKYGGNLSAAREALGISVNTLKKYLAS